MNIKQDNHTPDTNGTPVQAINVGKTLREARERLGMSVADVANRIKFAPRQIEWLEEDDYVHLPEAAFVRGFVRSYARLVELDPALLLSTLPSSHAQTASVAREVKSVEIPMPTILSARRHNIIWLAAALIIALSLAIFERLHDRGPGVSKPVAKTTIEPIVLPTGAIDGASAPLPEQAQMNTENIQEDRPATPVQVAPVSVPVPAPVHLPPQSVRIVPTLMSAQQVVSAAPTSKAQQTEAAAQQPVPQKNVRANSQASASAKSDRSTSAMLSWQLIQQKYAHAEQKQAQHAKTPAVANAKPKVAEGGEHALRIELDADAWIEVKDGSDKILISKMYPAGSLVRVAGRAPLLVTLGNASTARLFDNGKKINLTRYTSADVAKVKLK
jgi:cytoskeleton protein RodZ